MGPHFFKCGNAASFQPLIPLIAELQWGRTFSSAETLAEFNKLRHEIEASMGPHFFKCGNLEPIGPIEW